jgi:glycerate kinase
VGAERTAVIEMSEASGLWRIAPSERDPRRANTYGTGVLLRDAVERGAQRILLGLGGSATTDGGAGMAAAMGFRFLAADSGEVLEPFPCRFAEIGRIDASESEAAHKLEQRAVLQREYALRSERLNIVHQLLRAYALDLATLRE